MMQRDGGKKEEREREREREREKEKEQVKDIVNESQQVD